MKTRFVQSAVVMIAGYCLLGTLPCLADPPAQPETKPVAGKPADAKPAEAKPGDAKPAKVAVADVKLDTEQAKLADKYGKLEKAFSRFAELVATTDPKQAALLRQAFAESRSRLIDDQLNELVKQLAKDQLYSASKGQVQVQVDLNRLLELLQSGDSAKKEKSERELIRNLLGRLDKMIKNVEGIHGLTEGDGDPKELADRQGKEAEKAKELAQDIRQLEPKSGDASDSNNKDGDKNGGKPGDKNGKPGDKSGKPGDGKPSEAKPGEGKPGEGKPGEGKPGEGKPGEGKPGEGEPGEGKPGQGKPGEGKPGEGKPGQGKPGQGKPGVGKPGEGKPGDKSAKPGEGKPSDAKPGEGKPGEGKPSDAKPGEGKPGEGKPGEGKPGEGKPGEGKPGEGKPGQGKPGEGKPGEGGESQPGATPPDDDASPARKRVEAAEERMRQAQKHLEEAKRKDAAGEQQQALAELNAAKLELEKILRQLREEEVERVLAQLEARFRHMLTMQIEVYEGTVRVDKIPQADRGHDEEIEAGRLSRNESAIVIEADRALNLLHEEGSAVAFPESVGQMREDMQQVADRLASVKVELITQGVEQDIIAALQETIAALQKAQKDRKSKPGKPGKGGQPQEDPLVDQIAELKMIRALQMRINLRTKRYAKLLEGDVEQADRPDLVDALQHLGDREDRVHAVTHDIVVGKNH